MNHADRPDPEAITLNSGEPAATPEQVLAALDKLDVEHNTITHEPLYTVEQSKQVPFELPGAHTKNPIFAVCAISCKCPVASLRLPALNDSVNSSALCPALFHHLRCLMIMNKRCRCLFKIAC